MTTHDTVTNITRKVITLVLAGGLLAATGTLCARENPVDPVTNPEALEFGDVKMKVEEYAEPFQRTGTLVKDTSVFKKIVSGMPAARVQTLLGKPLEKSGGELGGEWNYHFTLTMPVSGSHLVCQYKVVFDDEQRVKETVWRRDQCRSIVMATAQDTDGDGVSDGLDECPNTFQGVEVNANGCIVKAQTIVLQNVHFATASAELTPAARQTLKTVVNSLKSQTDIDVVIAGYTDNVGPEASNEELSEQRARSVRGYLIRHGIESGRLTARGYGESQPIATNATEAGRGKNRRVVLSIHVSGE